MKRTKNGDIFTIPIENGNCGLGQILEKSNPTKNYSAMMVLFDIQLTEEDVSSIEDFSFLHKTPILSLAPLDLFKFNPTANYRWKVIGNIDLVTRKIPLVRSGMPNPNGDGTRLHIVFNFEKTKYRYVEEEECTHTLGEFSRSSIYFESLLNIRFFNKNYLDKFPNCDQANWYLKWPDNCMTEEDFDVNGHLYQDWPWSR